MEWRFEKCQGNSNPPIISATNIIIEKIDDYTGIRSVSKLLCGVDLLTQTNCIV